MKKLLFGTLLMGTTFFVQAQSTAFKPFKVDLAFGYAAPSGGQGTKGGVIVAIEPKYAINDNITLGLRMEGAVTAHATVDEYGDAVTGDAKASSSYLLTGDYYFTTSKFRPFAGIGAGIYSHAAIDDINAAEEVKSGSSFGVAPRVGFEIGHFRTAIEYNVAGKTGAYSNNYLGIKMGFFIGGGRLVD
jgi:outer membrane protein X